MGQKQIALTSPNKSGVIGTHPRTALKLLLVVGVGSSVFMGTLGIALLAHKMPPSVMPARPASDPCTGLWIDDFMQDYVSARAWRDGLGIYSPSAGLAAHYLGPGSVCYQFTGDLRNPHPPAFVVFMAPLSFLPYHLARLVWLAFSAVVLAGTLTVIGRRLGFATPVAMAIGMGSLAIPIEQKSLSFGQSNEVLLCLIVLCWVSLRQDRDRRAGLFLGAAVALKFFPVLLLIPILRERRYKAAGWMLGMAAALSLSGALLAGPHATETFLRIASPHNFHFWVAQPMNISLIGAVVRWLTPSIWFTSGLNLPAVATVSGVLVAGLALAAMLRTKAKMSEDLFLASIPWMILISPLAWEHYSVAAFLVLLVVLAKCRKSRSLPSIPCMIGWAAVLVGVLPWVSTKIGMISVATDLIGYGVPVYGLLLLAYVEWRGAWKEAATIEEPNVELDLTLQPAVVT